jgi:hypothetical protein
MRMTINTLYVPFSNLPSVFLDKDTGLPLAAGVVKFYRDSQRVTPKMVYMISGVSPNYTFAAMGTQLTLGINGGFVDGSGNPFIPYAYPYDAEGALDLYFITVESSGGVAQESIEACPYVQSGVIPPEQRSNTDNELINPQFVEINFPDSGSTILSVTGTDTVTSVAPGWDIITTGTGTLELERLEPTAVNVPTNPPYALRINASSGFGASIILRQRLDHSPSIMRNGYASGTMTIAVIGGGSTFVKMEYVPSTGTSTEIIPSTSVSTDGAYHNVANNAAIPDQVNDPATTGYVDINITLPTSRNLAITSVQVVGVLDSTDVPFDEQSVDRQKAQLFGYYEDAVVRQPKADIAVGWNFGLNPWQFRTTTLSNVANNTYTADQTIIIQQAYVDSATANNIAVGRAAVADNYAFQVQAVTATNKFMVLQYIDPQTIRPYWGDTVSVRLRGAIVTTNSTAPKFKVRLMYKAGLPGTISQTVPVSAWDAAADSIPTVSGDGWTYLTAVNDPSYTLTGSMVDFDFNGFVLPASSNANMTIGIAFFMLDALDETGTADVINIEKISFVNNQFAIDSMPQTFEESLARCQYHYEKTYEVGTLPGTSATSGIYDVSFPAITDGSSTTAHAIRLELKFMTVKRAVPTITFHTPTGTTGNISVGVVNSVNTVISAAANKAITQFTLAASSTSRFTYDTNNTTTAIYSVGSSHTDYIAFMQFHFTADSRLGV